MGDSIRRLEYTNDCNQSHTRANKIETTVFCEQHVKLLVLKHISVVMRGPKSERVSPM